MLVGGRGDVKIWFGLRPEHSICLDVTHRGDCLLSSSASNPSSTFTAHPSCGFSEYCVHPHKNALVNLSLTSDVISRESQCQKNVAQTRGKTSGHIQ